MPLKACTFTRTNRHGATENCYITFADMAMSWTGATLTVAFNNFESKQSSERKVVVAGTEKPLPLRDPFILELKDAALMAELMLPLLAAPTRLEGLSDLFWSIALTTPFVPDYVLNTLGTAYVETKKSLTDLNATLIEIPLA